MYILRKPFQIIRAYLRVYLALNALAYGLLIVGMGAAFLFPELNTALSPGQGSATQETVTATATSVWLFALVIFLINVFGASLLATVLPSLIVPFSGIVVFAFQALYFGIVLTPADPDMAKMLIPHSLTLLIELQAYVLVMLGVYQLGRSWLRPTTIGASTRRQGYVHGLRQLGWLSLPALVLFVVGAVYEAYEIFYLIPPLI